MAEIEIEKKKPIWPWIILVLVILALLYFLVFDEEEEVLEEDPIEEYEEEPLLEEDAQTTRWEDQTSAQYAFASEQRSEAYLITKEDLSS